VKKNCHSASADFGRINFPFKRGASGIPTAKKLRVPTGMIPWLNSDPEVYKFET
jgi:hypothetical protein